MSRFANLEFTPEPERSASTHPLIKDESYHLEQAQAAWEEGDFEQALRDYGKVMEYNPQSATAWIGQVRMLIELGEFREANVWADKALERFPHEAELLAAKAVALARSGDLAAALTFSDASIQELGDAPYIWLARGDVLLARREKRADYCFEKVQAMVPNNWFFHWLASRVYAFYQKLALALKWGQQALALNAQKSVVWLQMGLCQHALGMADPAKQSFEQALQLNPENRAAATALRDLPQLGLWKRLGGWWRGRMAV